MRNKQRAQYARKAMRLFQEQTRSDDENAISDLICDLMHLAETSVLKQDALEQVRRGIYHWYAETNNEANSTVEISITDKTKKRPL